MNPIVFQLATYHHSQWTLFHGQSKSIKEKNWPLTYRYTLLLWVTLLRCVPFGSKLVPARPKNCLGAVRAQTDNNHTWKDKTKEALQYQVFLSTLPWLFTTKSFFGFLALNPEFLAKSYNPQFQQSLNRVNCAPKIA